MSLMRLESLPLGLKSSTLPLSHCAPKLQTHILPKVNWLSTHHPPLAVQVLDIILADQVGLMDGIITECK